MQRLETELDGFGGSTGPALPGEVWTAPAERNYASHACGDKIHYALLLIDPAALDVIQSSRTGRLDFASLAGARDEFLHQATRKLMAVASAKNDDVSTMLAESLSQTICLHLCQTYTPGPSTPRDRATNCMRLSATVARQLREFIHGNLCEHILLDDLSKLAGLTKHQLLIAFRKTFGTTPAQYIILQRLRCAQRQLIETKKDVTTIALDSGFSSHSHLTTCFVKHFGCGPAKFRASGLQSDIQLSIGAL